LLPLPDITSLFHKEEASKAEFVKKFHEKIKEQIGKQTKKYVEYNNKGRKKITFEERDWVWLHLRKDKFPSQRKSKLIPKGDGPFQVLHKINDNAYLTNHGGSPVFNFYDLTPFTGLIKIIKKCWNWICGQILFKRKGLMEDHLEDDIWDHSQGHE